MQDLYAICWPAPAVSAKSSCTLTALDYVMFPWLRREGLSVYRGLFRIVLKTVYQRSVITQRLKYWLKEVLGGTRITSHDFSALMILWSVLLWLGNICNATIFGNFCISSLLSDHWLKFVLKISKALTSRKVAGSIPNEVIGFLDGLNPSIRTMAQGSTKPLTHFF
jgi:hypothetical protein